MERSTTPVAPGEMSPRSVPAGTPRHLLSGAGVVSTGVGRGASLVGTGVGVGVAVHCGVADVDGASATTSSVGIIPMTAGAARASRPTTDPTAIPSMIFPRRSIPRRYPSRVTGAQRSSGGTLERMASDSSFDIVSKIDRQEADNALNQARKEVEQRYDFKGTGASIEWSGESILIKANSDERAKAVLDVFQSKLIKRGISLKSLDSGDPQPSGKEFRIVSTLKEGISSEDANKISKMIRDEGPKSVKTQIQGDELRVQSKSRDDLQEVQRMLKAADLDVDLQFVNYR